MKAFRVVVAAEDEEAATAVLWEAGTAGIEIQAAPAGRVALLSYFADERLTREALGAALSDLPGPPLVEPAEVPDVDWVARFREGFRAFRAGAFDVVPVWEMGDSPADSADSEGDGLRRDRLVVDPGRAFGTGTHETTRLCLRALEDEAARRPLGRVVDVGAGTGLLGVAAARRGAQFVVGVDNDPEAVASVKRHAALNDVRLEAVLGDGGRPFRPGVFDLVLANLMAPLLLERRDEIVSLLAPSGTLVLSGLLLSDVHEVVPAYAHVGAPSRAADGDWAALVFRRGAE
jgi:ribosomal protein L11 methyltransferase